MEKTLNIEYNIAQLCFVLAPQPFKILEWGRGTGKSTILAKDILDKVTQMPRSTGVMVAETFAQIKTRTLPSTISGFEQHGLIKDVHYFVGKRPPENWGWPEPYEPPIDYSQAVYFWNGTVMLFLSQDGGATSGRGLNIDWVVGDEAARLDEEKFYTDVLLTNRGGKYKKAIYPDGTWKYFKDCPLHHSVTLATSTPVTQSGRWILKYEKLAIEQPEKYAYLIASAEVNRKNLGDEYFENAKATMPKYLYDAEIHCIRMRNIEDGFYPRLDETKQSYNAYNHEYYHSLAYGGKATSLGDTDVDPDKPLIAGIDWGANINCMVVAQRYPDELRFLKNLYVKYPEIINDMIKDFVDYYQHHRKKELYLWYDATGNNKQANSKKTYADEVKEALLAHGWTVHLMTRRSNNESHELKYKLWINLLDESDPKYPKIRFNKTNCTELIVSMSNAPAVNGRTESIRKDKSSERKKNIDQVQATHLSDAADYIVVGLFIEKLSSGSTVSVPTPTQVR